MAGSHQRLLRAAFALALLLAPTVLRGQPPAPEQLAAWLEAGDVAALRRVAATQAPAAPLAGAFALFLEGDLDGAVAAAEAAKTAADEAVRRRAEAFADLVASWKAVFSHLTRVPGEGPVAVYVPPAQAAWAGPLAAAVPGLVQPVLEHLGVTGTTRCDVVFLDSVEQLGQVLGVAPGALEKSGTLATTRYGRIFLLSPAGFPGGYPWSVVVTHEAVHLALARRVPGRVPHLAEEGVAALLQEWSATGTFRVLTPMERALLFLAAREGFLPDETALTRPYWEMDHPLTVQVAFLQAMLVARTLVAKGGDQAFLRILDEVAAGKTWDAAVEAVTGLKPESVLSHARNRWKNAASREYLPSFLYSRGREWLPEKGARIVEEGKRTVLLGDLLWGRGHREAALAVYRRLPDELLNTPDAAWRVARLLMEMDRDEESLTRVSEALERHPRDSRLLYCAALLARRRGDADAAQRFARAAWRVNPFANEILEMLE